MPLSVSIAQNLFLSCCDNGTCQSASAKSKTMSSTSVLSSYAIQRRAMVWKTASRSLGRRTLWPFPVASLTAESDVSKIMRFFTEPSFLRVMILILLSTGDSPRNSVSFSMDENCLRRPSSRCLDISSSAVGSPSTPPSFSNLVGHRSHMPYDHCGAPWGDGQFEYVGCGLV